MKISKILAGTVVVAAFFVSCSKDKTEVETQTQTLVCKGQTVDDYLLWAGTADGGKQVDTKNLPISDIFPKEWIDELDETTHMYQNMQVSFANDDNLTIKIPDGIQTYSYYFRNDTLYLTERGERDYMFGVGNRNKIIVRDGFFHVAYNFESTSGYVMTSAGEFQNRFTLEDVFKRSPFESLNQMVHHGDSIAIYNVSYILEKE